MKKGEIYTNRFNHYDSTVVDVNIKEVTLKSLSTGVTDTVKIENFNMNWIKKQTNPISNYEPLIRKIFNKYEVCLSPSDITVKTDKGPITLSIENNRLVVTFSDTAKKYIGLDSTLHFLLEDIEKMLTTIASLLD